MENSQVNREKYKKRVKECDLILNELKKMRGIDLEPYLSEFVFDMIEPGTRIVLKFPVSSKHVFNPRWSDCKTDDHETPSSGGTVDIDKLADMLIRRIQECVSESNEETEYRKEDFLASTKPYDFVNNAKDRSEREERFRLVCDNAIRVGIYNFEKLLEFYERNTKGRK